MVCVVVSLLAVVYFCVSITTARLSYDKSVCSSVGAYITGILSKQLHISSNFFHHLIVPSTLFEPRQPLMTFMHLVAESPCPKTSA